MPTLPVKLRPALRWQALLFTAAFMAVSHLAFGTIYGLEGRGPRHVAGAALLGLAYYGLRRLGLRSQSH